MKSSVTKPAAAVEQCQVKSRKRMYTLFILFFENGSKQQRISNNIVKNK